MISAEGFRRRAQGAGKIFKSLYIEHKMNLKPYALRLAPFVYLS
jgi:hypothetical protein